MKKIYSGYDPNNLKKKYLIIHQGREYVYLTITDNWEGNKPSTFKIRIKDAAKVVGKVILNENNIVNSYTNYANCYPNQIAIQQALRSFDINIAVCEVPTSTIKWH